MKKYIKDICVYIIILATLGVVYIGNIVVASSIHTESIRENAIGAYEMIVNEGLYPSIFQKTTVGFYDNFSDAIYVNIILNQDKAHPLTSGVANYWTFFDYGKEETPLEGLNRAIYGGGEIIAYSNYWLGIILPLKIMLIFFSWGEIRYILYFLAMMLQAVITWFMYKKIDWRASVAYIFSTTLFCLTYNVCNIEAASDLLLMQIVVMLMLLFYEKVHMIGIRKKCFFVFGSVVFFMGFAFAPMYELGMVCLVCFLLDMKKYQRLVRASKNLLYEVCAWGIGYGVTALAKQGLAYYKLGNQSGLSKFIIWSSSSLGERLIALKQPFQYFINRATLAVLLLFIVIMMILVAIKVLEWNIEIATLRFSGVMVSFGFLFPFVWCAVFVNAAGHGFYCQNLMPFIFAGIYGCLYLTNLKTESAKRIRIISFGGGLVWLLRKHCSNVTSKIMLKYASHAYSGAVKQYISDFEQQDQLPLFKMVNIETINRCNGKCTFCPANVNDEKRSLSKMSDATFEKVIKELGQLGWEGQLFLNINNEPFIDAKLIERAQYARDVLGNKVCLSLFTNGTLLSIDKLIEAAKVLDVLVINNYSERYKFTPHNRELYDFVKKNPELFKTLDISIRRRYTYEILATKAGSAPNKPKKNNSLSDPCVYPYTDISIFPDGTVGLCCNDCYEVTNFGNVNEMPLIEIWRGKEFSEARQLIGQGRTKYIFCKECDVVDSGFRVNLVRENKQGNDTRHSYINPIIRS